MEKILVVEDDQILAENIALLLENEGYIVDLAYNGEEGYQLVQSENPDLIICDINMPQMDGFELKEELNKCKSTFDIPLLFLTAKTQISDLRYGMGLGADDYIFKPYNSDELIRIIKLRLEKRKSIIDKIKYSFSKESKTYAKNDTFLVKGATKSRVVKILHIKLIFADVQYSKIILSNNDAFLMRISLNNWESKLPHEIFKRIHRSTIINFNFVEAHYSNGSKYCLKVKNWDENISISRRKYSFLKLK